jgi:hypothetical protein
VRGIGAAVAGMAARWQALSSVAAPSKAVTVRRLKLAQVGREGVR